MATRTSKFLTAVLNGLALGYFSPFNPENTLLGLGATETEVLPEVVFNNSRVDAKGKKLPDGIEIRFGGQNYVPSQEARERLKAEGFRWSEKQKMWYAYDEPKTRSFVEEFATSPVKVLQFSDEESKELTEKNWFWAKVRSTAEWKKVPNRAAVKTPSGKKYKSELQLSDGEVSRLIAEGNLFFTKFYEKPTGLIVTQNTQGNPSANNPNAFEDYELSVKLRSLADGMEKTIQLKLNPPIAQQRKTHRRVSISRGMRQEGLELLKVQQSLYALADAYIYGSSISTQLRKFRTKLDLDALVTGYDGVLNNPNYNWSVPKRLVPLGVKTMEDWRGVYEELAALVKMNNRGQSQIQNEIQKLQAEVDEMTDNLVGKKIPGFFPTPNSLIERVLKTASLYNGLSILEPTAGKGDIIFHLLEEYPFSTAFKDLQIQTVEIESNLVALQRKRLELYEKKREHDPNKYKNEAANVKIYHSSFENYTVNIRNQNFDRVIMNPPFEKGKDIDLVLKAYEMLKPEGILVAIMSEGSFNRSYKRDRAFQQWVNEMQTVGSATLSEPIRGAFSTAQSFVQTGVTVRILKLERKPSVYSQVPQLPSYSQSEKDSIHEPEPGQAPAVAASSSYSEEDDDLELLELEAQAQLLAIELENELKRSELQTALAN